MSTRSEQETVILTGATSQLGVFLIPRLLSEGFRVLAFSRQVPGKTQNDGENLRWMHPDVISAPGDGEPQRLLKRAEKLISCGPLDVACTAVSNCPGLRRVVAFSTSSVFTKASSPERDESELIRTIIDQETRLKRLCEERDQALLILRPTLIYGCGLDRNVSQLASWIRRYRCLPLAGQAKGLRQPVHADDLAQVAVAALTVGEAIVLDSPACGGSTLSYRQMVERIFESLGLRPRVVRLPTWMLAALVGFLAWLPIATGVNREMVRRQNLDLVFDDSLLQQKLNYKPRLFRPSAADFEIPRSAQKYQALIKRDASGPMA